MLYADSKLTKRKDGKKVEEETNKEEREVCFKRVNHCSIPEFRETFKEYLKTERVIKEREDDIIYGNNIKIISFENSEITSEYGKLLFAGVSGKAWAGVFIDWINWENKTIKTYDEIRNALTGFTSDSVILFVFEKGVVINQITTSEDLRKFNPIRTFNYEVYEVFYKHEELKDKYLLLGSGARELVDWENEFNIEEVLWNVFDIKFKEENKKCSIQDVLNFCEDNDESTSSPWVLYPVKLPEA